MKTYIRFFSALSLLGIILVVMLDQESINNSDIALTIIAGILFLETKDDEKTN